MDHLTELLLQAQQEKLTGNLPSAVFSRFVEETWLGEFAHARFELGRDKAEDAADVTQSAFITALHWLDTFDPGKGRASTWLRNITDWQILTQFGELRRHRKEVRCQDEVKAGTAPAPQCGETRAPAEEISTAEEARTLLNALSRLPENWRHAIVLSYFDGLTAEEVAEKLGISGELARTWIHRGILKLRDILKADASELCKRSAFCVDSLAERIAKNDVRMDLSTCPDWLTARGKGKSWLIRIREGQDIDDDHVLVQLAQHLRATGVPLVTPHEIIPFLLTVEVLIKADQPLDLKSCQRWESAAAEARERLRLVAEALEEDEMTRLLQQKFPESARVFLDWRSVSIEATSASGNDLAAPAAASRKKATVLRQRIDGHLFKSATKGLQRTKGGD